MRHDCVNISFWSCVSFLILGQSLVRGGDQSDLLTIVRAQHRAARESIRTLRTDVTREFTFPNKEFIRRGKYWRSFQMVRVQEYPIGTTNIEDKLIKDGEIRHLGRHRIGKDRYDRIGASRGSAGDACCVCDVWWHMLIEFNGPLRWRYDYDSFLGLANRPPQVNREKLDGHDCIRVSMTCDTNSGDEWSFTLWHDVKYNYLVRKKAAIFGAINKEKPYEYEILEFRECAPGVFLPVCSRLREFDKSTLKAEELTTLSNILVNEPLSNDIFMLPPVPAGTMVHDHIEGTRYPVDANWNRAGPATPFESTSLPTPTAGPAGEYHAQTEEEPESSTRWLVPAALVVLAAAGGCWVYRRWQAQACQTACTREG